MAPRNEQIQDNYSIRMGWNMFDTYTKHETFVETWMGQLAEVQQLTWPPASPSKYISWHQKKAQQQVRKKIPQVTNDLY